MCYMPSHNRACCSRSQHHHIAPTYSQSLHVDTGHSLTELKYYEGSRPSAHQGLNQPLLRTRDGRLTAQAALGPFAFGQPATRHAGAARRCRAQRRHHRHHRRPAARMSCLPPVWRGSNSPHRPGWPRWPSSSSTHACPRPTSRGRTSSLRSGGDSGLHRGEGRRVP